jgi:hypothetical protein
MADGPCRVVDCVLEDGLVESCLQKPSRRPLFFFFYFRCWIPRASRQVFQIQDGEGRNALVKMAATDSPKLAEEFLIVLFFFFLFDWCLYRQCWTPEQQLA